MWALIPSLACFRQRCARSPKALLDEVKGDENVFSSMIVHTTHDTDEEIYHHPREFAAMVKAFLAEHFHASSYSSPLPEKTIGPNNKKTGY